MGGALRVHSRQSLSYLLVLGRGCCPVASFIPKAILSPRRSSVPCQDLKLKIDPKPRSDLEAVIGMSHRYHMLPNQSQFLKDWEYLLNRKLARNRSNGSRSPGLESPPTLSEFLHVHSPVGSLDAQGSPMGSPGRPSGLRSHEGPSAFQQNVMRSHMSTGVCM